MWNPNVRPHGEYFAKKQAVTTSAVVGNQTDNNPTRMDQAQGGSGIRVVVPLDGTLAVAAAATITLNVRARKNKLDAASILLGTAVYTNDTGAAVTLGPDATVCEFILPQATVVYPFISVEVLGSAAPTGSVDIFPHYISAPHRG
jgi:hypothetical protein